MAKMIQFKAENFKRLQAVVLELGPGLNVLGGRNAQGKTSALDAIMSLLRGERYTPSSALHEGAKKGSAEIVLDNGVTISTTYTANGRTAIRVTGADGDTQQAFLDKLFGKYSLDVREFLGATDKTRNEILLRCVGIDLTPWREKHQELYDKRTGVTQAEKRAKGHYESLPYHGDVGADPVSARELVKQSEDVMARNAERANARRNIQRLADAASQAAANARQKGSRVQEIRQMLTNAERDYAVAVEESEKAARQLSIASDTTIAPDESTAELQAKLNEIDAINAKVRANQERAKAEAEWKQFARERDALSCQIDANWAGMLELIQGVAWPIDGLSVGLDGSLTYRGKAWDCMSTAQQYMVATAIQATLSPDAKIVLVDRLEVMDEDTQGEFAAWCEANDIQVIGTRVTTNADSCDWIIEDGMVRPKPAADKPKSTGLALSL